MVSACVWSERWTRAECLVIFSKIDGVEISRPACLCACDVTCVCVLLFECLDYVRYIVAAAVGRFGRDRCAEVESLFQCTLSRFARYSTKRHPSVPMFPVAHLSCMWVAVLPWRHGDELWSFFSILYGILCELCRIDRGSYGRVGFF